MILKCFLSLGQSYLSVPELKVGQRSIRGARLAVQVAPLLSHDDVCFSFSHLLMGRQVGVLQLFVRAKGGDQRWALHELQLPSCWERSEVQLLCVAGLARPSGAEQEDTVGDEHRLPWRLRTGWDAWYRANFWFVSFVWLSRWKRLFVRRCCWRPSGDEDAEDWSPLMMSCWDKEHVDDITSIHWLVNFKAGF